LQQNNTFSPIASCIRTVSPDILPTTSPVFVSLSKKAMSCLNIVFKYVLLIRDACLSPVTIQQVTSDKNQTRGFFLLIHNSSQKFILVLRVRCAYEGRLLFQNRLPSRHTSERPKIFAGTISKIFILPIQTIQKRNNRGIGKIPNVKSQFTA
jgi:hypothetical protein